MVSRWLLSLTSSGYQLYINSSAFTLLSLAVPWKPSKADSFLPGRKLLDALGVDHMLAIHDLAYMLQHGSMFQVASQAQA